MILKRRWNYDRVEAAPACSGSRTFRLFVCTHQFATVVGGERARFGVEFDVSLNGAKVMIPGSMNMGDQLAISLRLPDQLATMNDDATVRWGHTLGLEFTTLSQFAETRMRKFLSRAPSPQS